jgi:hypothetical protein
MNPRLIVNMFASKYGIRYVLWFCFIKRQPKINIYINNI